MCTSFLIYSVAGINVVTTVLPTYESLYICIGMKKSNHSKRFRNGHFGSTRPNVFLPSKRIRPLAYPSIPSTGQIDFADRSGKMLDTNRKLLTETSGPLLSAELIGQSEQSSSMLFVMMCEIIVHCLRSIVLQQQYSYIADMLFLERTTLSYFRFFSTLL